MFILLIILFQFLIGRLATYKKRIDVLFIKGEFQFLIGRLATNKKGGKLCNQ